jgi:hypothetical protein
MTNYQRFAKTINWELPDGIMTYDLVDHAEILPARWLSRGWGALRQIKRCES